MLMLCINSRHCSLLRSRFAFTASAFFGFQAKYLQKDISLLEGLYSEQIDRACLWRDPIARLYSSRNRLHSPNLKGRAGFAIISITGHHTHALELV
ncbi:hypothetical protein [uncultured Ruegeria sp.]|uniref:hypothetical protein n=1 Tax=uncultured Ruegeria sp. TaxID=259304 RepID=UPI00262BB5C9|nr:hypothetical protein [uncultured Ruegeria sp.]